MGGGGAAGSLPQHTGLSVQTSLANLTMSPNRAVGRAGAGHRAAPGWAGAGVVTSARRGGCLRPGVSVGG